MRAVRPTISSRSKRVQCEVLNLLAADNAARFAGRCFDRQRFALYGHLRGLRTYLEDGVNLNPRPASTLTFCAANT